VHVVGGDFAGVANLDLEDPELQAVPSVGFKGDAHLEVGAHLGLLAGKGELFFGPSTLLFGRAVVFFPFFSVLEDLVYGNTDGHQPGKCGYPREDSVQCLLAHFPILQSEGLSSG
jgi:hypothetical protein